MRLARPFFIRARFIRVGTSSLDFANSEFESSSLSTSSTRQVSSWSHFPPVNDIATSGSNAWTNGRREIHYLFDTSLPTPTSEAIFRELREEGEEFEFKLEFEFRA